MVGALFLDILYTSALLPEQVRSLFEDLYHTGSHTLEELLQNFLILLQCLGLGLTEPGKNGVLWILILKTLWCLGLALQETQTEIPSHLLPLVCFLSFNHSHPHMWNWSDASRSSETSPYKGYSGPCSQVPLPCGGLAKNITLVGLYEIGLPE